MSEEIIKESQKAQEVFRRRVRVIELKFIQGIRQSKVAAILEVNKSTITRDVMYLHSIRMNELLIHLERYVKDLREYMQRSDFRKKLKYDDQKDLEYWLDSAQLVLNCYRDEPFLVFA